jgi:hypothetical protein
MMRLRIEPVAVSCDHGNEESGSVKAGIPWLVGNYKLLKTDSAQSELVTNVQVL